MCLMRIILRSAPSYFIHASWSFITISIGPLSWQNHISSCATTHEERPKWLTSIQLKLKVVMDVCNYVIFLANLLIFNSSVPASQGASHAMLWCYVCHISCCDMCHIICHVLCHDFIPSYIPCHIYYHIILYVMWYHMSCDVMSCDIFYL